MSSECVVIFDDDAYGIKESATPAVDFSLQPFSDENDLSNYTFYFPTIATFEPDFWLLDGNYKLLPDTPDNARYGIISEEMSDENGEFYDEEDFESYPIKFTEAGAGTGLAINNNAALSGDLGGEVPFDGTNLLYWKKTDIGNLIKFVIEFLFDPNSITYPTGNDFTIFQTVDSGINSCFRLRFQNVAGQFNIRLVSYNDSHTPTYHSVCNIDDAPVKLRAEFVASSAPGANDGTLKMYFDDVLVSDISGLDNDTKNVNYFEIGIVAEIDAGASGSFYIDDVRWTKYLNIELYCWNEIEDFEDYPIIFNIEGDGISRESGNLLNGIYCGGATFDGVTSQYWYTESPNNEPKFIIEFLFDPNSITYPTANDFTFFEALNSADGSCFRLRIKNDAGQWKVRLVSFDDSATPTYDTEYNIDDAPVRIRAIFAAATGIGNNDGTLAMYFDDVLKHQMTGLDTDTQNVASWRLGIVAEVDAGGGGTMLVDDIKWAGSGISINTGITLYFDELSENYPSEISISFLDAGGTEIFSDTYYPNGAVLAIEQAVEDFSGVVVTVPGTNNPRRYFRFTRIDYDELVIFRGTEIKSAILTEEINPTAIELPANKLELQLFSDDGDFNIINPGDVSYLEKNQAAHIYCVLNGATIYCGTFYLDDWKTISANVMDLTLYGAIIQLEQKNKLGFVAEEVELNSWYSDEILDYLFEELNFKYDLGASLIGIEVFGWMPAGNCRESLQLLCFALGAYATCTVSKKVVITPMILAEDIEEFDLDLTSSEKGIDSAIEQTSLVTGVEVISHNNKFSDNPSGNELINTTLEIGTYLYLFDRPILGSDLDTGGTYTGLETYGANYIEVEVTAAGTFWANEGSYLIDDNRLESHYNPSLPANAQENIIRIEDAYLVNDGNVSDVVTRLYTYYQQRLVQKTKLTGIEVHAGYTAKLSTSDPGYELHGIVEKVQTDLANGFVSDVEIRCIAVAVS